MAEFLITHNSMNLIELLILAALVAILFWIGTLVSILRKSLNEIVNGLNSLDERLSRIEKNTRQ